MKETAELLGFRRDNTSRLMIGPMRVYWHPSTKNFGDVLTPIILRHLGYRIERAGRHEHGKVVAVGSVMNAVRPRDTVWGAGVQFDQRHRCQGVRFLAVRGPLTRSCIDGAHVPAVYGDPALLLPAVYDPDVTRSHRVGIVPHYMDARAARARYPSALFVDVYGGWRRVIRQMKACDRIIATSLHGIIVADAYGIPVTWHGSYTGRILSRNLKFQDYFLGTGRPCLQPGPVPALRRDVYARLCARLRKAATHLPA